MDTCYVGLGGNVGDVARTFRACVAGLRERGIDVTAGSGLYRTQPVGEQAGGAFLNAAVEVQTDLPPERLLGVLQAIEADAGRRRTKRWGPRTLDLDILLFGSIVLHGAALSIPHPACWYRRFVLDPLADVAGERVHPQFGETVHALRRRLLPRPLPIAVATSDPGCDRLGRTLRDELGRRWGSAVTVSDDRAADCEPALTIQLIPAGQSFTRRKRSIVIDASREDVCAEALAVVAAATDSPELFASAADWMP